MGSETDGEEASDVPATADLIKLAGQIVRKLNDPAALGSMGLLLIAGIVAVFTKEALFAFGSAVLMAFALIGHSTFKTWSQMHVAMKKLDRKVDSGVAGAEAKLQRRRRKTTARVPATGSRR